MLIGTEKNPKGPNFNTARMVNKDLSGTKIIFFAPPHRDPFSSNRDWESEPNKVDIYDTSKFQPLWARYKDGEKKTFNEIHTIRAYSSIWEFRGLPILEGYCGDLICTLDIHSVQDLPVNESLFNNRVLFREAYRAFSLTKLQDFHSGYSDDDTDITDYRWPSYLGPINVQWVNHSGLDWLYFEDQPLVDKAHELTWCTAIGDSLYLTFSFSFTRSARNAGNPFRIESRIPKDNFLKLANNIFNSSEIQLSGSASIQRATVRSDSDAMEKPIQNITSEQIEEAEYILYMWSAGEYRDSKKHKNDDHRAAPEEIAAFIDERIKPRPLPNSYPPGELLKLSPQPVSAETQSAQTCAK